MTAGCLSRIAEELGFREQQVAAAISLLDGGATVPFVARYRKEATGVLDDAQLRTLEERLRYLRELDERRAAILDSIGPPADEPTCSEHDGCFNDDGGGLTQARGESRSSAPSRFCVELLRHRNKGPLLASRIWSP
jgi:hypothetical protein